MSKPMLQDFASHQIATERAIAELRFGRPVILRGTPQLVVWPAEQVIAPHITALAPTAKISLLLSASRLNHLDPSLNTDAKIDVPLPDIKAATQLAFDESASLYSKPSALSEDEAAVLQLMRFAKFVPAAFVAEILPSANISQLDLLTLGADDIAHYHAFEPAQINILTRATVPLADAQAEFVVFGGTGLAQHLAVIVGAPDLKKPVLTRLHSACLTGDLFASLKCDCGDQLRSAVKTMAQQSGGILLYLDQEGRGHGLTSKLRAYGLQAMGMDTFKADDALGFQGDERDFEIGAIMLKQLGVSTIMLMTNNPAKVQALQKAGLTVATQALMGRVTKDNLLYLETKRDSARHALPARLALPDA